MEHLYYFMSLLVLVIHYQIPGTNQKSLEDTPLNKNWWFLRNGTIYQDNTARGLPLYPEEEPGDRILEQLLYIPKHYRAGAKTNKIHNIVFYPVWFHMYKPKDAFKHCPVNNCALTLNKTLAASADAIVFPPPDPPFEIRRPEDQLWIFYSIESPLTANGRYQGPYDVVNWTMTYRRDSDIVASYGKWVYYDPQVKQKPQEQNYAAGKTKQVAWFVSNCQTGNERLKYAKTIARHNISVDIYGSCSDLKCPKEEECFEMLQKDYKFYLAFENSNCRDYITEKFFENALNRSVIPIVMGTKKENYEKIAPKNSFIHVEQFSSHAAMAAYLRRLDDDDDLYNTYFRWKGTGEFILYNAYAWCRLCSMLNAPRKVRHYSDIHNWWSPSDVCYPEETIAIEMDMFYSSGFARHALKYLFALSVLISVMPYAL